MTTCIFKEIILSLLFFLFGLIDEESLIFLSSINFKLSSPKKKQLKLLKTIVFHSHGASQNGGAMMCVANSCNPLHILPLVFCSPTLYFFLSVSLHNTRVNSCTAGNFSFKIQSSSHKLHNWDYHRF